MERFFPTLLEAMLLVTALSVDALVAGFAYGSDRIKIPIICTFAISFLCSLALAISLFAGTLLRPFIPPLLAKSVCIALLSILGVVKLFDSSIKHYIRQKKSLHRRISFSALHLRFILTVYADPQEADRDASRCLSMSEAATLGTALSLDGIGVGLSAALVQANCTLIVSLSFLIGISAILMGCLIGRKLSEKTSLDLSWAGGILLLALACLKV